jgi:hypothetical protein
MQKIPLKVDDLAWATESASTILGDCRWCLWADVGTIVVFVTTGVCACVDSTPRQPEDVEEPSVCPRSDREIIICRPGGFCHWPFCSKIHSVVVTFFPHQLCPLDVSVLRA